MKSPDKDRLVGLGVVAVQGAVLLAFFLAPRRHDWAVPGWLATVGSTGVIVGTAVLLLAAANLGRSLTPLPTPTVRATLRTGGLYRFVRHPIYTGVLTLVFGATAASGSAIRLVLAVGLLGLLTAKATWEETMLRRRYSGYDEYARRTPRFFPRFRRRPPA